MRFGRFSPSGKLLVTVGAENAARVWNIETGERIASLRGHTGPIRSVAFSHDGRLVVTAADDGTVRIWRARTGGLWAELWQGHAVAATTAVFAPGGRRVFVGDERGEARIYACELCGSVDLRGVARRLLPVVRR
jgi:WD40 repeat protein